MFLETKDAKIYYEDLKKDDHNKTIIFVNGLLGCANAWDKVLNFKLQNQFRCVLFNLRGQDFTQFSSPFTYNQLIGDMKQLIEHLNLKQVNLVGDAFGANLALDFTYDHPHLVEKLLISSPTGKVDMDFAMKLTHVLNMLKEGKWEEFKKIMTSIIFNEKHFHEAETIFKDKKIEDVIVLFEAAFAKKVKTELEKIAQPVCLLHAKNDQLIDESHSLAIKTKLKNCKYIVLKSSHAMIMESALEYANLISDFF